MSGPLDCEPRAWLPPVCPAKWNANANGATWLRRSVLAASRRSCTGSSKRIASNNGGITDAKALRRGEHFLYSRDSRKAKERVVHGCAKPHHSLLSNSNSAPTGVSANTQRRLLSLDFAFFTSYFLGRQVHFIKPRTIMIREPPAVFSSSPFLSTSRNQTAAVLPRIPFPMGLRIHQREANCTHQREHRISHLSASSSPFWHFAHKSGECRRQDPVRVAEK